MRENTPRAPPLAITQPSSHRARVHLPREGVLLLTVGPGAAPCAPTNTPDSPWKGQSWNLCKDGWGSGVGSPWPGPRSAPKSGDWKEQEVYVGVAAPSWGAGPAEPSASRLGLPLGPSDTSNTSYEATEGMGRRGPASGPTQSGRNVLIKSHVQEFTECDASHTKQGLCGASQTQRGGPGCTRWAHATPARTHIAGDQRILGLGTVLM